MSGLPEDPFQMDEELDDRSLKSVNPIARESNQQDQRLLRDGNTSNKLKAVGTQSHQVPNDIPELLNPVAPTYGDVTDAVDDDEQQYEEDLDDKLDRSMYNQKTSKEVQFSLPTKELTPPENFAPVINNIYRSSFPHPNNFTFLRKLKLKSVLCLIPEDYPDSYAEFFQEEGIHIFQLGMSGNKEPFVNISNELITEAVKIVLDPKNQPILIHCNRGKHRTGCLVGVLRRLQKWSLSIIFDEYRKFAAPKERPMDQQFIELYDESDIERYAEKNGLLPIRWD
ncbi:Piso0_001370 [Millerozyma farinosa CBS 7064]|uniref:diphosphoinositol-polyphosphate diphosphatase n=1 Tax=Pichia sorbitophila (strain ATCC MYA-4447 / BCRC 22081 / CBS 7064 / NBRC 10061 / NRRL Y-12695) TaxID=559304 RepID=G8YKL4_PICSO|nr:Piso0_001370 [Millerozyma farinosa CBS 7064]